MGKTQALQRAEARGDLIEADWADPGASARARKASRAREAVLRRRRVDPTTCDLDYSEAELEFMRAMQAYKQSSGRAFPTWSEALQVLEGLGYRKVVFEPEPPPGRPAAGRR